MRLYAIILAGALGWFIGKALNVPVWRDGWDIGDRTDIALTAAMLVWALNVVADDRARRLATSRSQHEGAE